MQCLPLVSNTSNKHYKVKPKLHYCQI
uniref:Uncharacterized protein n=1 Tax=Rhizophora mucronata TaxID=61149 RepID=A0A2P2PC01_RHIMU